MPVQLTQEITARIESLSAEFKDADAAKRNLESVAVSAEVCGLDTDRILLNLATSTEIARSYLLYRPARKSFITIIRSVFPRSKSL